MQTNDWLKAQAKQDFTDTDYALKLYSKVLTEKLTLTKEPKSSDEYQPSAAQKQAELISIGGGLAAVNHRLETFIIYELQHLGWDDINYRLRLPPLDGKGLHCFSLQLFDVKP